MQGALLEGMAAAGASVTVQVLAEDGTSYNPVTELVRGFASTFAAAVDTAEAASVWLSPPNPLKPSYFPSTPWAMPPAPGAPAILSLSIPETKALARANAAGAGWVGVSAAVLFEGLYRGLMLAAQRVAVTLSSVALAGVPPSTTLQFSPAQLVTSVFEAQLLAAWAANPKFAGGKPSLRRVLAQQWAACGALAWDRTRPKLLAPGTLPGVLTPPYLLTLAPTT